MKAKIPKNLTKNQKEIMMKGSFNLILDEIEFHLGRTNITDALLCLAWEVDDIFKPDFRTRQLINKIIEVNTKKEHYKEYTRYLRK